MNSDQYRAEGHAIHLKAFLEHPSGKALLELIEDHGKPSCESRKQYGGAEDVKLQMSLNYVAMEQTFAIAKMIKELVKPAVQRAPKTTAPGLVPEDASPEELKALGITIPEKVLFKQPTAEPATSVN